MKKLFLAMLLLACTVTHAEFLVMRTPTVSITLTTNDCPPEVADVLKDDYKDKFKEAFMMLNGSPILGCWIKHVHDPEVVILVTGDGHFFGTPLSGFKRDAGA